MPYFDEFRKPISKEEAKQRQAEYWSLWQACPEPCKICGKRIEATDLPADYKAELHHVKFGRSRFDHASNYLIICMTCHVRIHEGKETKKYRELAERAKEAKNGY